MSRRSDQSASNDQRNGAVDPNWQPLPASMDRDAMSDSNVSSNADNNSTGTAPRRRGFTVHLRPYSSATSAAEPSSLASQSPHTSASYDPSSPKSINVTDEDIDSRANHVIADESAVGPVESLVEFHQDVLRRLKNSGLSEDILTIIVQRSDAVLEHTCSVLEAAWESHAHEDDPYRKRAMLREGKERLFRSMYATYAELKNDIIVKDVVSAVDAIFVSKGHLSVGQSAQRLNEEPTTKIDVQHSAAVGYLMREQKIQWRSYFPIVEWLPKYNIRRDAVGDMMAGATIASMLIPQAMGYAFIAGLPAYAGLYTGLFPMLFYLVTGSSRHLCVGPVPLSSLVVYAAVDSLGYSSVAEQVALASMIAIFAGAMHTIVSLFRLGSIVAALISGPVISGFTSAGAIIIAISQLKYIFGISAKQQPQAWYSLYEVCAALPNTNYVTFLFSVGCIVILTFCKKKLPTFPTPLLIVVAGVLIAWLADFESRYHVKVVGKIPAGIPGLQVPDVHSSRMLAILFASFVVAIIDFMESYSIAKTVASRGNYSIVADNELLGIGLASIVSGFFGGYIAGGAMSRTIVNYNAGGRTLLSSTVVFTTMLVFLGALTSLIYHLPQAALGCIIFVAMPSLMDYSEAVFCYKNSKYDFYCLLTAFSLTLLVGVEVGVFTAIGLSLVLVIRKSSKPHFAVLGRIPGTLIYRNVMRFPEALSYPHVLAMRLDSNMFFANAGYVEETMLGMIAADNYLVVVLECSPINQIDATAMHALFTLIAKMKARKVKLLLACIKEPILEKLTKCGFMEALDEGQDAVFQHMHAAMVRAVELVESRLREEAIVAHDEKVLLKIEGQVAPDCDSAHTPSGATAV
jgi:SulP family sulfate permease